MVIKADKEGTMTRHLHDKNADVNRISFSGAIYSIKYAIHNNNLDALQNVMKISDPNQDHKDLYIYSRIGGIAGELTYCRVEDSNLAKADLIAPLHINLKHNIKSEESNPSKLLNLVYDAVGDEYQFYNHNEITPLYEILLVSERTSDEQAAFKMAEFVLKNGASPTLPYKNGSCRATFITKDTHLMKLLFSYGASPDIFDPLNFDQVREINSYNSNPVQYILGIHNKPELASKALNNLKERYECERKTQMEITRVVEVNNCLKNLAESSLTSSDLNILCGDVSSFIQDLS